MKFFEKRFLEVFTPMFMAVIALGVGIDLLTKYLIVQNFAYQEPVCYIGDFFCITLTFNTGFVFGIAPESGYISLVTTGLAIFFLIFYRWKNFDLGNAWGWNLVMIGAFGNFIDKFFIKMPKPLAHGVKFGFKAIEHGHYTGVVDFIDFDWPDFLLFQRWPAFNFADSCVSVGIVILIISMHLQEKKLKQANQG